MKLRLKTLELQNFKGVKRFKLDAQQQDIDIYGDNETGKTTVADAFFWLLFDKDSQNKKDFGIKTLKDGQPVHGIEHKVSAALDVDGKEVRLAKSFYEKWTKKRGSNEKKFDGHTTGHWVNDVPVSKKEYDNQIAEVIDENIFRLLTDPRYFNEVLHWQKRRELLLEVCGDITDADVIESDERLAELPGIIGDHSIEKYKKIIAEQRKKINKQLETIPVRIDEVTQALPDMPDGNKKDIETKIKQLDAETIKKQDKIADIKSTGEDKDHRTKLSDVQARILEIESSYAERTYKEKSRLRSAISECRDKLAEKEQWVKEIDWELSESAELVERKKKKMAELREEYKRVNAESTDVTDTCPTCGQALPAEQVQEAIEKANQQKADKLAKIQQEGKALAAEVERLEDTAGIEEKKAELKADIEELKANLETMNKELAEVETIEQGYKEDEEWQELQRKRADLDYLIKTPADTRATDKIEKEIHNLQQYRGSLQSQLYKIEERERGEKRIKELETEERKLAKEYERLEKELYLTEEFTRVKVNLLEERINSKFEHARFKLFVEQVNGGLAETCETLYKGVPYGAGLNNGARINVGLDIINTLNEHYGAEAPIFIDNREAVTKPIPTRAQLISLIVSEPDKELRVEYPENQKQEAV